MSTEAHDLAAARAGDADAFARLYDRHAAVVLVYCRRSASIGEAEDALQETFLRAFRKLDQLRHASDLRAWLVAIARRVCAERNRSARRRRQRETEHMSVQNETGRPKCDNLDLVERAEELDRLTVALDALPEPERLAIHLHYLDTSPREAAATLGVSRSGFYKLLGRARDRLASLMREVQTT